MSVRVKDRPPQEYTQVVWCPTCDYCLRITIQERRGDHFCMTCGSEMAVYEPRTGDRVKKPHLFAPPSGPSATEMSEPTPGPTPAASVGHDRPEALGRDGHEGESNE